MEQYLRSPSGQLSTATTRRTTQGRVEFPTALENINREMLSEVDESDDEDSDENKT